MPYQYLFPYSCKIEIAYNSILSNSTLPIIYEIKNIARALGNKENTKNYIICKNPVISKSLPDKPTVFSRYYGSSTFKDRFEIYSTNKLCKDKDNCKPLIRHESLIRDVLYPFKLVWLTIPLSIFILFIWLIFILKFFIITFNRNYCLKAYKFKIDGCDNLIPIVGVVYFIFNSANSPAVCICSGILFTKPLINFINKKIFIKNKI